jgi:hypothetical protein
MFPELVIYHNPLRNWLIGIGIAVLFFICVIAAKRIVHKKLAEFAAKTVTIWDDLLTELIYRLNPVFFFALAIYIGSVKISLPDGAEAILGHAVGIIALFHSTGLNRLANG